MKNLEVLFAPAEFNALAHTNLRETVCVVFDVPRATSTMLVALRNGAAGVIPVATIEEAVAWRKRDSSMLLAGERDGVRIRAAQSGGIDFDFGNSPREFETEAVRGRLVVSSTTNGTRALRACAGAQCVLAASFGNLNATAARIRSLQPKRLLLIGSGTGEETSFEDTLNAGAFADLIWDCDSLREKADSAQIARLLFKEHESDLIGAMRFAANGRRLLATPDLAGDVPVCLQRDSADFVAVLGTDGVVRREG